MKISEVVIHNFRSIAHEKIQFQDFSIMAGENNAGKTNVINAIRAFYEEGGMKYDKKKDFPKFPTKDNESWIEIEYKLTDDELESLKEEYRGTNSTLRLRRYFNSDDTSLVNSKQSNIYGYEYGQLSKTLFYGAKNISSGKLGQIIYIPELSKTSDTLKLSGPSPLRELANFVFKKIVTSSDSFRKLNESVEALNREFQEKTTSEGFNLYGLVEDINKELGQWGIDFGFRVNDVKPEDIVKNLLEHFVRDKNLNNEEVDIDNLGQGVQRHIIYTLLQLGSKYVDKPEPKKKDFAPDLTVILFEEPEAFLHPSQQENLNRNLRRLSFKNQVIITTHSPTFISRNVNELPSIIRLNKNTVSTQVYQIEPEGLNNLYDYNVGLYKYMSDLLKDTSVSEDIKHRIRNKNLGHDQPKIDNKIDEEAFQFSLWLNAERSASFFAKHVIICEGATEKTVIEYLLENKWEDLVQAHLYILDAQGKFNIHRFMGLFGTLGISHSVLFDSDGNTHIHHYINDFILQNKNQHTLSIDSFPVDLEKELDLSLPSRNDKKPLMALKSIVDGKVKEENINKLYKRIKSLVRGE
jgi:predicted ATP-dependent endonuclease of OLD family